MSLIRIGNQFNVKMSGLSTVHKATEVRIPSDVGVPRMGFFTLCGIQMIYEITETTDDVTCKRCLK